MFEMEFTGFEEVTRALEQAEGLAYDELAAAVDESGEDLLSKSQGLAPKLTGDLEGSGTKDPLIKAPLEITSTIGFRIIYAARRHEEVYNPGTITRGKPSVDGMTPGRKYIEQPLMKYRETYPKAWAERVRAAFERMK